MWGKMCGRIDLNEPNPTEPNRTESNTIEPGTSFTRMYARPFDCNVDELCNLLIFFAQYCAHILYGVRNAFFPCVYLHIDTWVYFFSSLNMNADA